MFSKTNNKSDNEAEVNCVRSEKSDSATNTNCVTTFNSDALANSSLCSLKMAS
jgi:hypothetical protein